MEIININIWKKKIFLLNLKKISLIPSYYIALPILTLILFLIPIIFWFNNSYYVGGDDTLLYYIYPREMINNYLFNIATDNVLSGIGSYSAQFYQLPFFLLITIIKFLFPFLNTQTFMYGLNLSMGFLFFYLFLGLFIKNKSSHDFFIKILGGLLYIFSIFSYYTLWQALFTPYLVSIFPILAYLFLKGVKDKSVILVILSSLVASLMSITLLLTPWLILAFLSIFPILIIIFLNEKKYFIIYFFIFISLTFLLNFYWIFHLIFPYLTNLYNSNSILNPTSSSFISSARDTITAVTKDNNLIYPLFNLFHKQIQINGGWQNYPIFHNWHEKFIYVNFLFAVIILLAGLMLKKTKTEYKKLYLSSLLGWLLLIYMFTVNIGQDLGLNLFIWLIENIPGFAIFRNVYGKIAPGLPFIYALTMVISLKIILDTQKNNLFKKFIIIFCFIVVIFNAKPFILNEYFSNPLWTTKNTYTTISEFNSDFKNLIYYLKSYDKNSRFLWIPITAVNYVVIRDQVKQNHYYTGLSPLQFLAGKSDIAGIMSFPPETQNRLTENFIEKKYDNIGFLLKEFNINYLIVNNDISDELQKSYFFASRIKNLYSAQDYRFKSSLLGKKIKSFNIYDLYEINSRYKSEKIFISRGGGDDKKLFPSIRSAKKNNYLYEIQINNISGTFDLIFLERYSPLWEIYISNSRTPINSAIHKNVYEYANLWEIDTKKINQKKIIKNLDGTINLKLRIYFKQQDYVIPGFGISLITLSAIISYLIFTFYRYLKKQ